jgi:hypothetical protein
MSRERFTPEESITITATLNAVQALPAFLKDIMLLSRKEMLAALRVAALIIEEDMNGGVDHSDAAIDKMLKRVLKELGIPDETCRVM